MNNYKELIENIYIYNNIKESNLIKSLYDLLIDSNKSNYSKFISEVYKLKGSIKEEIIDEILLVNNDFNKRIVSNDINEYMIKGINEEIETLIKLMNISFDDIKEICKLDKILGFDNNPKLIDNVITEYDNIYNRFMNNEITGNDIIEFHKTNGTGRSLKYKAFVWQRYEDDLTGKLIEIDNPDNISFNNLVGFESQQEDLKNNTLKFIQGKAANNVLLYGARGTGKSSSVKALLNEYAKDGLRLIEVDKSQLYDFTRIINLLRDKKQKFIIFVDDLTFDEKEAGYSALKTILEGRIEKASSNILIYATTNRRHLVVEKFSDSDEINANDTIEEKLSLSDRFGLTIAYLSCSQKEYFAIVKGLAKQENINMDEDILLSEARKWALWHNGMSPRTARQFINNINNK